MCDIRKRANEFFNRVLGHIPDEIKRASRYYPSDESWTHSPAWWHEIPIGKIDNSQKEHMYILCEKAMGGFHCLHVPITFIFENIDNLYVKDNKIISLFLSADPDTEFIDLRGNGRVNFGKWLI
jgi:hypothetical protein